MSSSNENSDYSEDDPSNDPIDQPKYFNGNINLPIVNTESLDLEDIVSLVYRPPADQISRDQPRKCEINASFVIDTRELKGPNDWKADDLGKYDNTEKPNLGYFLIDNELRHCYVFGQEEAHVSIASTRNNRKSLQDVLGTSET